MQKMQNNKSDKLIIPINSITALSKLSLKHRKIVKLIFNKDLNPTQAYLKVFDCDVSTARVNSSKLLMKADIKSALIELEKENDIISQLTNDSLKLAMVNEIKQLYDQNDNTNAVKLRIELNKACKLYESGDSKATFNQFIQNNNNYRGVVINE